MGLLHKSVDFSIVSKRKGGGEGEGVLFSVLTATTITPLPTQEEKNA